MKHPDLGTQDNEWVLEYHSYVPEDESLREALCTLGNGRFATRGAAPEHRIQEDHHYPGTYLAGVYNRLAEEKAGREIVNESMVNLPNWLLLTFRIDSGPWFSIDEVEILEFRQTLETDHGILVRHVRFADDAGRETTLTQRRLVSMARPAVAALETNLRPENWSGRIQFSSSIDGDVENRNVDRYRDLRGDHLEILDTGDSDTCRYLRTRTSQSRVEIVTAMRHRLWVDNEPRTPDAVMSESDGMVTEIIEVDASEGMEVRLEKVIALHSSRDTAISEPLTACEQELRAAPDFSGLESEHRQSWIGLWSEFAVNMEAELRVRQVTNLHIFHLLQVASPNVFEVDAGIPARGLHGEAYRGHIFWDELFIFPVLHSRAPEIARSLLRYRYRRLPAARRLAAEAGYEGAMFPWQSGSDGSEETQEMHLNPKSGRWHPDRSHRQRHINIAVAYNIIQYHRFTGDLDFLTEFGAELLIEIARFWSSIAVYNRVADRYDIVGVMGPDEFHDADPNWDGPGLRNNAYTNVMVSWLLDCVPRVLEPVPERHRTSLLYSLGIDQADLERWSDISRKLHVPTHEGVISQFEGYGALEEFDWDAYREKYEDIERLDRILEAEGDSPNRYKVSKQADVLMLFYLLSFEELTTVLARLGVVFDEEALNRNISYYLDRTSHGSTLSRLVHSWVLARSDRRRSMELFRQALESDVSDIQDGTTEEGIHLGAMAGTVDLLERGYSGMEAAADGVLRFKPSLPAEIERLSFSIYYQRRWLEIALVNDHLQVSSEVTAQPPIELECRGERVSLASGEAKTFRRIGETTISG
jgi:trehalose/maltose hydrolase-like predicted phosphorylase